MATNNVLNGDPFRARFADASGGVDNRTGSWDIGVEGGDPGSNPWQVPGTQSASRAQTQGQSRTASGVSVGSWTPFANYLNTLAPDPMRRSQGSAGDFSRQPLSDPPKPEGGPNSPPDPRGPGGTNPGNGLVAGPGLGGYYGQLSQQYLTGKRQ